MKIFSDRTSALATRFLCAVWIVTFLLCRTSSVQPAAAQAIRHAVPDGHPRLLGSRDRLQKLAKERPEPYKRLVRVARELGADDHSKMMSMALVAAIEGDERVGKAAVQMAMKYISGPIRQGHVTFGHDLARCAVVYDMCYEYWTRTSTLLSVM